MAERTEAELDEIFERIAGAKHGRRCDPNLMPLGSPFAAMLERHRRNVDSWLKGVRALHTPNMYPVYFGYVENPQKNAFTFVAENHGFIGVYVGTMVSIYSFFSHLLAHSDFLAMIGDPRVEDKWTSFDPTEVTRRPKDPARASFASLLTTIAIDYLFAHEIGHLMNGHVELARLKTGNMVFCEFDAARKREEENLTSQTLEMDADAFATTQGLSTAIGRASNPKAIFPDEWRAWYSTTDFALFVWILAIYSFFRLFFGVEPRFDAPLSSSHPPPNIRLSMIISTSVAYLVRRESEEPIKKLDSILAEVVPTIEKVYALWTSTPVNDIGIRTTMDDRTAEYTGVLLAHWKTLRPQLLPLVRGGNLAD